MPRISKWVLGITSPVCASRLRMVTDVTEGMYAFVEVSAPAPYAALTEPVIAHGATSVLPSQTKVCLVLLTSGLLV